MNETWKCCYTWFVDPGTFFKESFQALQGGTRATRCLAFLVTLALPVVASVNMATFLSNSAVAIIISRFVPAWLAGYLYLVLSLLLSAGAGMYYTLLRAMASCNDQAGVLPGKVRRFSLLNMTRNNLCFIPSLVLSISLAMHGRPYSWNALHLGTFLTVMFWTHLLWTAWILASSTTALPLVVDGSDDTKRFTSKHPVKRVLLVMIIAYLVTDLALSLLFTYLMGMERLPLFFKIAYFLLHGN